MSTSPNSSPGADSPSNSDPADPIRHEQSFASTHWSLVLLAARRGSEDSDHALAQLCEAYWPPLYAYVCRRISDRHAAQDLTQTFLTKLIEKNYLDMADPARGRFRTFLLTAIQHCIANERRSENAIKRGGGHRKLSLDFDSVNLQVPEPAGNEISPEQEFDRQWAITLLSHVMQRLEREQLDAGRSQQFQLLKQFLVGDNLPGDFADVASRLDITEPTARKAASRLRTRYRELLRAEISKTVASTDQIDEEIADLFRIFSGD